MAAIAAATAGLLLVSGLGRTAEAPSLVPPAQSPALSILTYNVHGLPWPLASGRPAAFGAIAQRLQSLRALGAQPHIVVLQEAFTPAAKRIGVEAGYRYIAFGPSARTAGNPAHTAADRRFEAGGSWFRGEGLGKFTDSGLVLLSDYPIVKVSRAAFPDYACAGFDCLANKGVLLASVKVPGIAHPVAVATTHLVSRFATGVADARNFYAYRREVDMLAGFLRANADPESAIVLAGDFNVGIAPGRRAALLGEVASAWRGEGYAPVADALRTCLSKGPECPGASESDAAFSLHRGRDWQLFAAAPGYRLAVTGIRILFGHAPDGEMLSDHVGYEADYALASAPARRAGPAARPATNG
ncbi:MAG: Endonuclease/exonuclease/phosphatase [Alphaproteobacteria bacterium]|nr:Endonuclease/exonuclease/phosphatase [Alphaproteobacteria bacterium]MDB5721899.1 Endonuclease/exonuclease/phosphatase [Alphaproteobacteria bacterium]